MDNLLNRILATFLLASLSTNGYTQQIVKDPTRPGVELIKTEQTGMKETANKKQLLSAIFIKQGKPQAIINDQLYQQGDYFSGKKIITIKSNKVVLQNANGVSHLTLINPIKKPKKP